MRRREFITLMKPIAVIVVGTLTAANLTCNAKGATLPVVTTIQCSAFKKMPDGTWYVEGPNYLSHWNVQKTTFTLQSIGPGFFAFGKVDLYKVLEGKCGAHLGASTR
jgi:hypothetical protein